MIITVKSKIKLLGLLQNKNRILTIIENRHLLVITGFTQKFSYTKSIGKTIFSITFPF